MSFLISAQNYQDSLSLKLNELAKANSIEGFTVAIVDGGGVAFMGGFGYANREKGFKYTTKTVQPIASISKTLIAVSLMKAQEMGKLDLDDDINKYLPFEIRNPHFPNEIITIRHLATHCAGLTDTKYYRNSYVFHKPIKPYHKELPIGMRRLIFKTYVKKSNENVDIPLADFLKAIYIPSGKWYKKKNFLKKKPGEEWNYSNNGSALTALVLEQATGMGYQEIVQKYILDPLGMESSGWSIEDYKETEKSVRYYAGFPLPDYHLITYPDGGFITNMEDFTKYFVTMIKGYFGESNILKADSYKEMYTRQFKPEFQRGIFWANYEKLIGHSGGDPGVKTYAHFDKQTGRTHILFMNTSKTKQSKEDLDVIWKTIDQYSFLIKK